LLLAFFVLLFSFSELDKQIYKQVAGSMRDAFGIQRKVPVRDPPKGVNIIAREFSPGTPRSTPLDEVRQFTVRDAFRYPVLANAAGKVSAEEAAKARRRIDRKRIESALEKEIADGVVEVDGDDLKIIVRIREKGSFPSGSHQLEPHFKPVIERLVHTLKDTHGQIVVSGHTDSIPIETARFRSNWDLSAARAASVAHLFLREDLIEGKRVHLEAYADTTPVDTNETADGRARNRRVEIALTYGEDAFYEQKGSIGQMIGEGEQPPRGARKQ
jgi:chemotaxis protein MotB